MGSRPAKAAGGRPTLAALIAGEAGPFLERLGAVLGLSPGTQPIAIGWATVDRERTLADAGVASTDGGRDAVLGAMVSRVVGPGGPVVVLEPTTEGPLAAFLAKHGEGVCAIYVEAASGGAHDGTTALGRAGGLRRPAPRFGPFAVEVEPDIDPGHDRD